MADWEAELALKHAPVLLQKVHEKYLRADCVTKVNFAGSWAGIHDNWKAGWRRRGDGYAHRLRGHAYYSVVQTQTHSFVLYAFYHPQDWAAFWGNPARSSPNKPDQHLHDMEGALAIVPHRPRAREERVEAVITISHFHFYSYAGWEDNRGRRLGSGFRVKGWSENVDGPVRVTSRFAARPGEPDYRFKLYSHSGSHAILGGTKGWGDEKHVVRYRPSLATGGEPKGGGFTREDDLWTQDVPYRLVSTFGREGLWRRRDDPRVFQANDKGQEAFVKKDGRQWVPGSANPPWGWDDRDDRHQAGELAWDPAHLAADYFTGLREFGREYVHNPYLGVVKS